MTELRSGLSSSMTRIFFIKSSRPRPRRIGRRPRIEIGQSGYTLKWKYQTSGEDLRSSKKTVSRGKYSSSGSLNDRCQRDFHYVTLHYVSRRVWPPETIPVRAPETNPILHPAGRSHLCRAGLGFVLVVEPARLPLPLNFSPAESRQPTVFISRRPSKFPPRVLTRPGCCEILKELADRPKPKRPEVFKLPGGGERSR